MKILSIALILLSTTCFANDYQPTAGASGAQMFSEACAACHGDDGTGKFGLFFDLSTSTLLDAQMKETIQQGGLMMPAFANIKGKELDVLVTYIRSLGRVIAAKQK
ncbi:MAG: c-type cytochrome [Cycloclasticus sp.]